MPQNKQQKKKTEPVPDQKGPSPYAKLKTAPKTLHSQAPHQPATPTLKKKVSFPDILTRGRGTSYTPPEDDKAVRFSPSLVRGEGPSYSERDIKRDSSIASNNDHRVSNTRKDDSRASQSLPDEPLNLTTMEIEDTVDDQAIAAESEAECESDDSFTDIVRPINADEAFKIGPTQHYIHQSGHQGHFGERIISKRSSGSMQLGASDIRKSGCMSNVVEGESFPQGRDESNKRHVSLPKSHASLDRLNTPKGLGTAAAPTYNRRGHRLRLSPGHTSVLRQLPRRTWPEPLFIFRDKTSTTSRSDRSKPTFALRERSDSQINAGAPGRSVIAKSLRQQLGHKYQPPSVVDEKFDGAVRDDPIGRRTS
ncbi:MAG: hypothetical protein Q9168_000741 [Polycauliona sp. 1 TL-2023]